MKANMVLASVLVFVTMLCANAQELVSGSNPDTVIKLSRTSCFGECPIYRVEIHGDGTVVYEGEKFVRATGKQTSHISAAQVADLVKDFCALDFFSLKDVYDTVTRPDGSVWSISDVPSAITSVTIGTKTKTVLDNYGTPEKLVALERKIDKVTNTQQWIFVDAATIRQWAASGWNARDESSKYLIWAIHLGDNTLASLLLELGADSNVNTGFTPLIVAAGTGNREMVRALLQHGADPNLDDGMRESKETPLLAAARKGDLQIVNDLLAAGAKVDTANRLGTTPLMEAERSGHQDIVLRLLLSGATVQ